MREHNVIKRTRISLISLITKKKRTTETLQKDLRPRPKRVRQGNSNSALTIFVRTLFEKLFEKRGQNGI